jgi:predicted MPP superfamily phosphohydrolase
MTIVVTSDLHLETTGKEPIRRMVAGIAPLRPSVIVLAGDLGESAMLFRECLSEFLRLDVPVLALAGNHDLWVNPGEHSLDLFERMLPEATRELGFHWLDGDEPFVLGDVGIAGSIAWYDYSARDRARGHSDAEILEMKPRFAMDAQRVDWGMTDQEFAAGCRARLRRQLDTLEANPAVRRTLVVTHVPIFDNQMDRRPEDDHWTLGNPFFGHFTMGEEVARYSKVRWVISGHTHVGMNGVTEREGMAPIATAVIGSDYHKPRYVLVEPEE